MSVAKMELCKRVWALIVDEDTPTNEREEELVKNWEKIKHILATLLIVMNM